MELSFSPARAGIDLAALKRNYAKLCALAESSGKGCGRLMPVIKSDAYGHGLLPVARALDQCGAGHFAVGTLSEALALRKAGFSQEILPLLGLFGEAEWQSAAQAGVMPLLRDFSDIQAAGAAGIGACAIKLESGMGRLGFAPEAIADLLCALEAQPGLRPRLLLSHLACAENPQEDAYNARQRAIFAQAHAALARRYPGLGRSLGNSAGALRGLDCDLLRPGLALYGVDPLEGDETPPFPEAAQGPCAELGPELGANLGAELGLEPVLSLWAPILQVREILKGQSLSYGRMFTARHTMRVGVLGIGYANGLARELSGRFSVLVQGQRAPQVGRICMGMALVDLSAIPEAGQGERAWIIGGQAASGQSAPTASELARILGTIPYELLCLMGSLNKREYAG